MFNDLDPHLDIAKFRYRLIIEAKGKGWTESNPVVITCKAASAARTIVIRKVIVSYVKPTLSTGGYAGLLWVPMNESSADYGRIIELTNDLLSESVFVDQRLLSNPKASVISETIIANNENPSSVVVNTKDVVYSRRIDFITDEEFYRGEAAEGSAESAAVWRICKVNIAPDDDVALKWAEGNSEFTKQWINRTLLNYI
jgi:hypothetical protein